MRFIILFLFLSTAVISKAQITEVNNGEAAYVIATEEYISFSLTNKSMKSIPLLIPSVMNPNLSPNSRSGVTLKVGQEILFKYKGRKHVLLTVTPDLAGTELEVSSLLKASKAKIDSGSKK